MKASALWLSNITEEPGKAAAFLLIVLIYVIAIPMLWEIFGIVCHSKEYKVRMINLRKCLVSSACAQFNSGYSVFSKS